MLQDEHEKGVSQLDRIYAKAQIVYFMGHLWGFSGIILR